MTLKNHSTEAENLIENKRAEAEKWLANLGTSFQKLPGRAGDVMKDIVLAAFEAGYLKGVERTSELLSKRMDQLVEPGRKDYGDGGNGPTN